MFVCRNWEPQNGLLGRVGLIICVLAMPHLAKADSIYTSFVGGATYDCCVGSSVSGTAATNVGVLAGNNEAAGAFTPAADFDLTQIDVGFWFVGSPNSDEFTLSLSPDSGGMPGTAIETWTALIAPFQSSGTSSLVEPVMPVSPVELIGGSQYWIVATPTDSNTFVVWSYNLPGTGPGGIFAQNTGSGWSVFDSSIETLAFDVEGTEVPEPGTLSLLVVGLLGIGYAIKRKLCE